MDVIELISGAAALEILGTVLGIAVFASFVLEWGKRQANWPSTPWLALALAILLSALVRFAIDGTMTLAAVIVALVTGFFGASLAVFGYDIVLDTLGRIGIGPKTPEAKLDKAKGTVAAEGYMLIPRNEYTKALERDYLEMQQQDRL